MSKTIINIIIRLYRLTLKHIGWGILRFIGGVVSAAIWVYMSWISGTMIDIAINKDIQRFKYFIILLICVLIIRTLVSYLNPMANQMYSFLSGRTMKRLVMKKITGLPIAYYEDKHTGESISKLTNDIEHLQWFCGGAIAGMWSHLPTMLILSGLVLYQINIQLTIICGIFIMITSFIIGKISIPIAEKSRNIQKKIVKYNSYLMDFINGIHIFKAFNLKKNFSKKFNNACTEIAEESYFISKKKSVGTSLNMINMLVPLIISYGIGGIFVLRGDLSIGELIIFANVLRPFLNSFKTVVSSYQELLVNVGKARHLFELLDTMDERTDGEDYSNDECEYTIEFENVSFQYNDNEDVLNDVSFVIEKGKKVALVGASGSGKSTIHKLLCGFYDNYSGSIKINGKDIRLWNLDVLRQNISVVNQSTFLFRESIRENVSYGDISASDESVIEACNMAYVSEFAEKYPEKYDKVVGERGGTLSEGQKQRVSLARAILKDAPILLLDEPTSALDKKSEYYVYDAIEKTSEKGTVFIIAHRLSSIKDSDKIIVLDDGKIIGEGTHEELLDNNERYSVLYKKQICIVGEII